MKEIQVDYKGYNMSHIGPEKVANKEAEKIKCSPLTQSCTKIIATVPITHGANKELLLCDTPGFEDTEGPEVDLANVIGVIKAVKMCKTVRPVVLISASDVGGRF